MQNHRENIRNKKNNPFLKDAPSIEKWLNDYNVKKFTINSDLTVSVSAGVDLSHKEIKFLPVQFDVVNDYFFCNDCGLESLVGCPSTVSSSFYCNSNPLTSLVGGPVRVGGEYRASHCKLQTLEGVAQRVGMLDVSNNRLTSLKGLGEIDFSMNFSHNKITSLELCPDTINGSFLFTNNCLTSLEFVPKSIRYALDVSCNQIENLEFCPEFVGGDFLCDNNPRLGSIENVTNFEEIKNYHLQLIKIREEQKCLRHSITFPSSVVHQDKQNELQKNIDLPHINNPKPSFKI